MIVKAALIIIITSIVPAAVDVDTGYLSQFDQSPTDGTLYYRMHESGEIDPHIDYDGFIAVSDCDMIGREAWLKIWYDDYESDWLFVAAFDCSGHSSTTEWMDRDRIIAEVDYYTAQEHGFLDRGNIQGEIRWQEAK